VVAREWLCVQSAEEHDIDSGDVGPHGVIGSAPLEDPVDADMDLASQAP